MRLFIALPLSEEIRFSARSLAFEIRDNAYTARVTRADNMHLTLAFLGENPPSAIAAISGCMDRSAAAAFELETGNTGCFRRPDGDIWWLGLKKSPQLTALQSTLSAELVRAGFKLENRAFLPHITLCRDVQLRPGSDPGALSFPAMTQKADRIVLFESTRTQHGMVYTPMYETRLN